MRQPDIWDVNTICLFAGSNRKKITTTLGTELWVPSRPEPHNAFSPLWRFKLAWLVLTGKADCLTWEARAAGGGE